MIILKNKFFLTVLISLFLTFVGTTSSYASQHNNSHHINKLTETVNFKSDGTKKTIQGLDSNGNLYTLKLTPCK